VPIIVKKVSVDQKALQAQAIFTKETKDLPKIWPKYFMIRHRKSQDCQIGIFRQRFRNLPFLQVGWP